jgi:cysteine desulfurase
VRIYFDHNATTPVAPEVADAVLQALTSDFGNASSVHHFGQRAKARLDEARSEVAALIGGEPSEVVFTSGGTESDNFALRGVAEALEPTGRKHLVASAIEHEAVLVTLRALARRGWRTTLLPVDATGIVKPETLAEALADDTALVSVMHANNEIGTIQPIAELAALAHARGALFHTDAVQSVAKILVAVRELGVDLLSLSAHKFNGPKGAGALWIKRGTRIIAHMTGGKHERTRRAGTENVPGIVGLGVAA